VAAIEKEARGTVDEGAIRLDMQRGDPLHAHHPQVDGIGAEVRERQAGTREVHEVWATALGDTMAQDEELVGARDRQGQVALVPAKELESTGLLVGVACCRSVPIGVAHTGQYRKQDQERDAGDGRHPIDPTGG
jgi:hypothetical protein